LNHAPSLIALAIFQIGSRVCPQACLDHVPPVFASHIVGMTGAHHHTQFFIG
jgi:hypothetical protein